MRQGDKTAIGKIRRILTEYRTPYSRVQEAEVRSTPFRNSDLEDYHRIIKSVLDARSLDCTLLDASPQLVSEVQYQELLPLNPFDALLQSRVHIVMSVPFPEAYGMH